MIIVVDENDRIKKLQLQMNILLYCEVSYVHDLILQTWLMGAFEVYLSEIKHL